MRSNFLIFILWVVSILYEGPAFTEAFCLSPAETLIASGLPSTSIMRRNKRSHRTFLLAEGNSEEEKVKKLDTVANPEDVDDLPMFSLEYNSDNVDVSQLPVPPFTAAFVFFASTAFTIYLYYVGITGGVAPAPDY